MVAESPSADSCLAATMENIHIPIYPKPAIGSRKQGPRIRVFSFSAHGELVEPRHGLGVSFDRLRMSGNMEIEKALGPRIGVIAEQGQ